MSDGSKMFSNLPNNLQSQVTAAIQNDPSLETLFAQLMNFYENSPDTAHDVKKRKLNTGPVPAPSHSAPTIVDESSALKFPGVSMQTPARKKLDLVLTTTHLVLRKSDTSPPEYSILLADIESVFLVPIPEKAKPQWALIVNPKKDEIDIKNRFEIIMVTVADDNLKTLVKPQNGELYNGTIQEILILYFQRRKISITSEATMPSNQSLIHVSAYRGSKDGYLYFLPDSVFFGFKKPLLVFRLLKIISISYSSITKSTFNLIIKYLENPLDSDGNANAYGSSSKSFEIEFSMIDQGFFDQINKYVEFHGLDNESLAEERRAKVDSKAVFPDELIKASRETEINTDMEDKTVAVNSNNSVSKEVNLNTHDFASDDDEEDEDFASDNEDDEDED